MNVDPVWLDYGTLGLLAIVLISVGYAVSTYLKANFKQVEEQSAFVRSLAEKSIESQEEHMEAWKKMTMDTLATFKGFADAISNLQTSITTETRALHEDHKDIEARVRGLKKEQL